MTGGGAQITIRPELASDTASIHAVHCAGFPTPAEADLVDALRAAGNLSVSLVACAEGVPRVLGPDSRAGKGVVGHVALSPVSVEGTSVARGVGLAPLAVLPAHQRRGIGGELVRAGLQACREQAVDYVVVLGEPAYYRRFGFRAASHWRLESAYDAGDAFMALELTPGCLEGLSGLVRYGEEFQAFS